MFVSVEVGQLSCSVLITFCPHRLVNGLSGCLKNQPYRLADKVNPLRLMLQDFHPIDDF